VCNNTSDRKHADTVLERYVTETIMSIVTTFFSSPFSDQSTSLQTRQPVFVQLLQGVFRVYHCTWLVPSQKGSVEACIKVLSDVAKGRAIAIPVDLDCQVNNLFIKSNNIVQKTALSWRLSARSATRSFVLTASRDYRNIIERLQDIVSALEERLRPLVQAELSVLVDVLHRPELLFPEHTEAHRKCESGGFICKLIKHTKQLLEENEERLCIKVLQTLREMMTKDRGYGEKLMAYDDEMDVTEQVDVNLPPKQQEDHRRGEALRQILVNRYYGNFRIGGRRDSLTTFTNTGLTPAGPSKNQSGRAEMSLTEVQCHLDREGASDLVIDLIMNTNSDRVFQESILLAIALLEGGNTTIQRSFYKRLTEDKKSEKFFRVFYDRMKAAQLEIKATVTVNTSDLGNKRRDDHADRDTPQRRRGKDSVVMVTDDARVQLLEASTVTKKAFSSYRHDADPEEVYSHTDGDKGGGDKGMEQGEMSPVILIMQPILRFLQLLCENHNRDLQNFLRCQNNKNNYNLVCETLQFLDCICGSTTGGLGLLGLYINQHNVALINQTVESLTEYCQGPCHDNQNCIATHESNGIDIIIALILNDINPLGRKRIDLVLELKVCNNTSDRKHADTVLERYVTETIMSIVTTFFSSPFSDQSTSLQTRQPVFVQLLQGVFRVYHCTWLVPSQKGSVEACIKVLSDVAKGRAIAIPVDLDCQVNNLFIKSNNIVQKTALSWRLSARSATRSFVLTASRDYRNIIERLQDIVSALEERLRPLVQAELSVLVDVLHRPELLFPEHTEAHRKCESGGFICKLIKHTKQLLEENEERLCIKVLQTLREMMTKDRGYGEKDHKALQRVVSHLNTSPGLLFYTIRIPPSPIRACWV
ncbi:inositol 1,4,5-trisphosphate receptor type 1, partial [Tachysurus ichikawai]